MSRRPEALQKRWNYEPSTPMCCNCVGYRKGSVSHDERGVAVLQPPFCLKGKFNVKANGCCDKWSSRDGERLTT